MSDNYKISPEALLQELIDSGIPYENFHHEAVFTVEESASLTQHVKGTHCRNLALINKKKKMWLFTVRDTTPVDLKKLAQVLNAGRFSFMSAARLWDNLGVRPGSVTPFSILNDKDAQNITMVLEQEMMDEALVNYHPMCNTQSTALKPDDLERFVRENTNHTPVFVGANDIAPDA